MGIVKIRDTVKEAMLKMSEGNPGAMTVLIDLINREHLIDPDSALGGLGTMLSMDDVDIRGPLIWVCYKDLCGEDLVKMVGLWRGAQLGFVTRDDIKFEIEQLNAGPHAIGIDVDGVLEKVRARLPNFYKENNDDDSSKS